MNRDKSHLYPAFAAQITDFENKLLDAGLTFYLFDGYRSVAEQNALYEQGRSKPGNRVTNAEGLSSWHCMGTACDFVYDGDMEKPGIQWSWSPPKGLWLEMANLAVECGLEAGAFWVRFPDAPHVQNRYGLTINEAKELYLVGGLKKVWMELDTIRARHKEVIIPEDLET